MYFPFRIVKYYLHLNPAAADAGADYFGFNFCINIPRWTCEGLIYVFRKHANRSTTHTSRFGSVALTRFTDFYVDFVKCLEFCERNL